MLRKLRNRFLISFLLIAVIFFSVGVQLGNLTMAQNDELTTQSEDRKVRTISLKGSRGQIMDISGIPLAYDQSSYNVEFTRDPSKNTQTDKAYYTDILIKTVKLLEEHDGTIVDTFNIYRQEDGSFKFDFGVTNPEAHASREENWRSNMFVNSKSEPDVIYRDLRTRYRIPEEYTYEQARPLLSIWQEVQLSSYRAYVPVVVAKNVTMEAVAVLEAQSNDLDGISIAESSTRVYPKDDIACHIVGYTGRMVDEATIKEMEAKGYSQDDKIGITGIEATMEQYLTGNSKDRQGQRKVEVNSRGKVITELENTHATQGDNVMLTIDLDLQMVAEDAIEANVKKVYEEQVAQYYETPDKYDDTNAIKSTNRKGATTLDRMNLAQSGALVVMDVHTGDIKAMASYPGYDLNIFEKGLSTADWKALDEDPAKPLFNFAIASKGIPGSIFKMVTAMGGLMEGAITEESTISDEGEYKKDVAEGAIGIGSLPKCWVDPDFDKHQNLTLENALKVSCNYFFFETANRMGIEKLAYWGEQFGLDTKTNVELTGEATGQIGSPDVLYNPDKPVNQQKTSLPKLVRDRILGYLKTYGEERNISYPAELLEETADELVELAANPSTQLGPQIRAILSEKMEIPETMAKRFGWAEEINISLTELKWNSIRTASAGIGAEFTSITPIAVARYVSALVNGGKVYNAHVVDSVIDANGNVVEDMEPEVWATIDAPQEYFDIIKLGMRDAVSAEDGGTATDALKDWKYTSQIGGKTGTGKVTREIDLENNAWFVAFAPYDDPEIAVVSYIPNGWAGLKAIDAAKDVIEYYLDGKAETPDATLPSTNSLVEENPPAETTAPPEETYIPEEE